MQSEEGHPGQRTSLTFSRRPSKLPDSFTLRDLAATISKLLDLHEGNDIEIQRDKMDPNRLMIIRHPGQEEVIHP